MNTESNRLEEGFEYSFMDEEVVAKKYNALRLAEEYNSLGIDDIDKTYGLLKEILGSVGEEVYINTPFNFDVGKNIHIGSHFLSNYNLTILDAAQVHIGDYVMIGPNVLISTAGHPLSPKRRRECIAYAEPISIGNDVWIGGNVTILPGVNIGNNVVVAAGSVVTKDIPDNSLVAGVPARIIRELENDL